MNKYDEMDLSGRSDEDLENDMRKILEDDTFNKYDKYNNYSNNNIKVEVVREESGKSKLGSLFGKIILYSGIVFLVIFILNFEEIFYDWNYDDYEYEEIYDIEYDFDEDGYLDYEEQHTYELDKATDYEKNYIIKEMFIDKERRSMYFELENRNSYNVDFAHLNVAFYDEEGRLVDVEEKYIDNILTNQKVIECIDYNRPFATYDVNITVEWTSLDEEVPNNNANMEIVSKEINKEDGELIYTIKNNSEKEVSGDIYVIFYDEGNKIVNIYRDYVYDLKSGGTEELEAYIYDDSIFSTYDIVLTGVQVDEY